MSKQMYFGTRERMTWVNAPAINSDISKTRWSNDGVYLNGGGYADRSVSAHRRYAFNWNLSSSDVIYAVLDYADGLYGSDLVYFLDPFAQATNVLPTTWASPRVQASDAPTLTKNVRPTLVDTAVNAFDYPTKSAVFTLLGTSTFRTLWVPIPTGYSFYFGWHGVATGSAAITLTPDTGSVVTPAGLNTNTSTLTNATVASTGVTISASGTGQLTIAGMIGQVLPTGSTAPTGSFQSGRGHSGCRFGPVTQSGYSAPSALDLMAATAMLIETGDWEQ